MAALGQLGRTHGYPLLAEAIAHYRDLDQVPQAFRGELVGAVLASARGMGIGTARKLARHHDLDPATAVADLPAQELERLRVAVADAAAGLPDGIEDWRRRLPKSPSSGEGGGPAVLQVWVEQVAPPRETARDQAIAASRRDGFSRTAAPTLRRPPLLLLPGSRWPAGRTTAVAQVQGART